LLPEKAVIMQNSLSEEAFSECSGWSIVKRLLRIGCFEIGSDDRPFSGL